MKNKLTYFYVLLFLAFSCTNKERLTELEIYTFLEICYEDYYFNYDLEITPLLEDFEQQLIKEGHLKDSTGIAYKELLKKLESETFFSLPLKDRKSTRLNSSHVAISYAVFCLKKKKNT